MAVSPEVADAREARHRMLPAGGLERGAPLSWGAAAEKERGLGGLPGLFYSYLGYGIALRERRIREGLKLCRHSIKVEFYQAENYFNLARTCLLANDRKGAVQAVRGGLKIDRHNPHLLALYKELGIRSSAGAPLPRPQHTRSTSSWAASATPSAAAP